MAEKSWFSTRTAATLLKVSIRTVQNWVDTGKIEATLTVGGHRRIPRKELIKHLALINPIINNFATIPFRSDIKNQLLRVLFVEDDYAVLRLCEMKFSEFSVPHELLLANNAYQGMLMVGKYQPNVIFTDLNMPDIDGIQMINEILNLPGMKYTKIVVVTGMDASEIDKMGLIPEGVVVLPKPIPFNTIETILSQQSCEIAAIGF